MIQAEILTLFPDMVLPVLNHSILKRAQDGGHLKVRIINIRDYSKKTHKQVDDAPYGGGAGMVLGPEPFFEIFDALKQEGPLRLILTTPRGKTLTHETALELSRETRKLVFICGHYEGIDERIIQGLPAEEVSIGDYILTGGELAALVILDAATRLVPGVLGDKESVSEESFLSDLLEYPHYTRPPEFRGMKVPPVLLSGHHEAVRKWRLKEALRKTMKMRPDLLERKVLTDEESNLVEELRVEENQTVAGNKKNESRCGNACEQALWGD